MGHSSIKMTFDLYGHLFEDADSDRDAMKKLEAALVLRQGRDKAANS